ncbi:TPA: type II toxin-antitoxin system HigA family antitoxin [Neisseria bacilliformis]|jgi:predicted transcription regulator containing HTH domain|uniref:XRE family transcriptional regulator n=1 Tax=Neisseria bacilliformis ATCC BAA-1200 TaxID=888742 RepID=F2BD98_9NEIS|nr:transcriptional regulator [Neisseria bacilliformis]EGF10494.1 XRE family transcriptional regulator [Neisseria bacilliformis ATCC BAA-1200]QMT48630.1 transcriptional regulator [Neisseria bacilliformis]DAX35390.1 MAG TPA: putative transcriptional regulator [Caudoviricetes sp.]
MNIKPIRTDADYRAALQELGVFFDNDPDNATQDEADRCEVLAALVEQYEAKHCPIDPPDPIEAIKFRMEQGGLTVKDMGGIIGRPNRVYEVFSGKRPLSLAMIRRLHSELGISADILIRTV